MKLLLVILSTLALSCSGVSPVSVDDRFQQIQQEVEQLKENYEKRIEDLERQLKLGRNWATPSGEVTFTF